MIFGKAEHGGDVYSTEVRYDFSANINPLGTPESVRRAVMESVEHLHQYPDPCCRELVVRIAEFEKVPSSYIMCGCGAAELIFSFCAAAMPKKALELAPTFSEYSAALEQTGCQVERYSLKRANGFALTEAFLPVLRDGDWDALFLCSPNNPTGRLIPPALLEEIVLICHKKSTRLFLDECFLDLSDGGQEQSMKRYLEKYPGLFILKAFTKNYGMAGLRLGYCLSADRELLTRMSRTVQSWNVSVPAQAAGIAALEETDFLARAKEIICQEKEVLRAGLEALGFWVCPSEANYLLFYSTVPLAERLLGHGILIRDCSNYHGLCAGWYRVAVKKKEDNQALLASLREILGG